MVLKWDFSGISPQGDGEEIRRNLYRYDRIRAFSDYYQTILPDLPRIDSEDALASFRSFLDTVRKTDNSLYLLIDEYDNFANELLMGHRDAEESRYQALLSGEGCMKVLFKTIKMAAGGQGLGPVFITGVSPVAMSDLTSAYNVAENIYLLPHFDALCGFRETEIVAVLAEIARECDLPQSDAGEALTMMRTLLFNDTLYIYGIRDRTGTRSCGSDHDRVPRLASVPSTGYPHRVQIRLSQGGRTRW